MSKKGENNHKEIAEFEYSLKQRNFEIDLFWKRSWFFGALILAEVAAFYKLKTESSGFAPPVILAFMILLTTLAQCLMNRGSKYWQERWEYMTMNRESALNIELTKLKQFRSENLDKWFEDKFSDASCKEWFFIDASILSKNDNFLTTSRRFSVSKITFLVWDIIFLCALLCWLNESYKLFSPKIQWEFSIKLLAFYTITIGYILWFWRGGNVFEPYKKMMREMNKDDLDKINGMYVENKIDEDFFKLEK